MDTQKNQDLIDQLLDDLTPVRRVFSPFKRALLWFVIGASINILLILNFAPNLLSSEGLFEHTRVWLEIFSGFVFIFSLSFFIFKKVIPGEEVSRAQFSGLLISALAFLGIYSSSFFLEQNHLISSLWAFPACEKHILIWGLAPLPALFYIYSKGLFMDKKKVFFLTGLMTCIFPALLMQLACDPSLWHSLAFHYAPVLYISVFGLALAWALKKLNILK